MAKHGDYKKVRKEGGTQVISVGKLIPKGWHLVKLVEVAKEADKSVTLRIEKAA